MTVTLLDNSQMTFDFSAFKRQGPLTGSLRGYVPGKILPDADNQVILTSGSFTPREDDDVLRQGLRRRRLRLDPHRRAVDACSSTRASRAR